MNAHGLEFNFGSCCIGYCPPSASMQRRTYGPCTRAYADIIWVDPLMP